MITEQFSESDQKSNNDSATSKKYQDLSRSFKSDLRIDLGHKNKKKEKAKDSG